MTRQNRQTPGSADFLPEMPLGLLFPDKITGSINVYDLKKRILKIFKKLLQLKNSSAIIRTTKQRDTKITVG